MFRDRVPERLKRLVRSVRAFGRMPRDWVWCRIHGVKWSSDWVLRGLPMLGAEARYRGSMKQVIESTIQERGLSRNVVVLDPVAYECMPGYYAAADLFVLASVQDPCPLSVVEALHSGLPLLLSRRLGNASKALEESGNWWSFDPLDLRNSKSADVVARFLEEVLRLRAG